MKKIFVILLLILLAACSEDNITGSAVNLGDELVETQEDLKAEESLAEITGRVVGSEPVPATLEERLQQAYAKRAETLKKKRELLMQMNNAENFEQRQFYQKALDLVRERESQLTLSVRILESRLERQKRIEEGREMLPIYRQQLEYADEDISEMMDELALLGEKILELRQSLKGADYEAYASVREEMAPLEEKELSLLASLKSLNEEKDELEENIEFVISGEIRNDEDMMIERHRVIEELGFVQDSMVKQYLLMNTGTPDEKNAAEIRLDSLELQKDELKAELRDLDKKLGLD